MANIKKSNPVTFHPGPREQLLREAIGIVSNDRNKAYGNPEDNFKNIAVYWSQHLTASTGIEITVTALDVAHMNILQKMARLSTNPTHHDSTVDVAGYAACAAGCVAAEQDKIRGAMSAGQSLRQTN